MYPLVLDVPERQVNPRQGDIRFFWYLMLEVFKSAWRAVVLPYNRCA